MIKTKAVVFDAYGTLFDVNSAAKKCKDKIGAKWEEFANFWRTTQLEYTWLRSLMKRHKNFWDITEDSLDKSIKVFNINKFWRYKGALMKKGNRAGNSPIGIDVLEGKSYFWCTCGISSKQPFCDGSHKGTEFIPFKYLADQSKKVFFCSCKQTNDRPLCDGSHNIK